MQYSSCPRDPETDHGEAGTAEPTLGLPLIRGITAGTTISDGAGGLYLAGRLDSVDDLALDSEGSIVHILPSGELDDAFEVDITDSPPDVYALALSEDALYIGGNVFYLNGATRLYAAAVDPDTGDVLDWAPTFNGTVYAFAVDGDVVYVSGDFTTVSAVSRPLGLVQVDATTGSVTDWAPTAVAGPTALQKVTLAGETVLLWGYGFGGKEMVAFDANGDEITAFDANANAIVRGVVATDTAIWVGGAFSTIGGESRSLLAALDPATGDALAFDPDWGTFEDGFTGVYAGGGFTGIGRLALGLAAFDLP